MHAAGGRLHVAVQPSLAGLLRGGAVVVHQRGIPALQNGHHFLTGDGLLLQQVGGDLVQHLPVVLQHLDGVVVGVVDELADLFIHLCGGGLGAVHTRAAVQVLVLDGGKTHDAEAVAHAVHGDHLPGQVGGPLDVVGRAGGHGVEHRPLGGAAAQQRPQVGQQLLPILEELLLLRGLHGVAQRTLRVGHDGDLADGLCVLLAGRHQSVAHLVIGNELLLLLGQHGALLLGAGDDHFKGGQQIVLVDGLTAHAHRPQGGLVDQVGQIRAHAARSGGGDLLKVHVLTQTDVAGVHLKGGQTSGQVGPIHGDPAVEAAGAQQRLIQHLGPVGGAQHDDALGGVKAVQLGQQLVQGLLALVVAADAAAVALLADGVDLVDEDDAGGHLGGLLKEVADTAGAHAHEHLHKVRAGDGEEGDIGLARHGLGQQGLAGAGRAHQQRALGQLGADGGVFAGVVEEVDDLLQTLLGLVLTGHIPEGDAGGLFHIHLCVALADIADAHAAAHLAAHEEAEGQHHNAHDHQHRQQVADQELCEHV